MAQDAENSRQHGPLCLGVLCVRNEGAFLVDWLAHHLAVGFNRFLVFSNNCQDGTDTMLDRLEEMGWITHLRNEGPYHARGIQFTALKQAQSHPLVREADWILPFDIDEYVAIKTGDHTLSALFAALPDATAITLTWRLFGNRGTKRFEDVPITRRFQHAAPELINWPWRAVMFKTLYRNDGTYRSLGVHRPRNPDSERLENARWYDSSGRLLPAAFKTKRLFSDYGRTNYKLAQLNHYPLGDMESFVLKADRGRVNRTSDKLGLDYWVERNFADVEDLSAQTRAPVAEAFKTELLQDETLAQLHKNAVTWRKRRFSDLLLEEEFRALYGRLLMTAPSQLVSVQDAEFMINFALRSVDSEAGGAT